MAEKSPAFQFYPKDFLTDDAVLAMTNEQIGAYVLLLCHAWLTPEGISTAQSSLARMCHCTTSRFTRCIWPFIEQCFSVNDAGRLVNRRLEAERVKQQEFRAAASRAGKLSAAQRALNGRSTNLPTEGQRTPQRKVNGRVNGKSTLLSSSSSAVPTTKNVVGGGADAPPSPSDLLAVWNEHRGALPEAQKLTPDRSRAATARLCESPDLTWWAAAVRRMASSAFCRGEVGRQGWRADFDFLIRPGSAVKVHEGKYDGPPQSAPPPERKWCEHEPECATKTDHTRRWLDEERARRVSA